VATSFHADFWVVIFCHSRKLNLVAVNALRPRYNSILGLGYLLYAPAVLSPGKEPPLRITQEAGSISEPVWNFGEEKNLFSLSGIKF
jgi:hypothetical protein